MDQYELIHGTDWDTLIILDALRWDFFKAVNKLEGKLIKCQSRAVHTYNWLEETWPDYYDLTYFSAHPWIDEKYIKGRFDAPNHFKKVVPIHRTEWNDQLGTVHPKAVCEYVKNASYEKAVIHFLQPHGPWIGKIRYTEGWTLAQHNLYGLMGDVIAVTNRVDPTFLRKAYRANLRLVLETIEKYKDIFKGNVVITSDHGEMLGEYDKKLKTHFYLHSPTFPEWVVTKLKDVPWLIWQK